MSNRKTRPGDPDVYLVIGDSAIARDPRGEILETVEWGEDGLPDWEYAGICDDRGAGGRQGFQLLFAALESADENYQLVYGERSEPVATA